MVFEIKSAKNRDDIKRYYKSALEELNTFFKIKWTRNTPKIFLISSREEFDNIYGKKTEEWVVGTTMGSSHNIYLLAPESYEKHSNHTYSEEEYEALLKHEMSHLYTRIFYQDYIPRWLIEGVAIYSSGQLELKRKPKKFNTFLEFFGQGGKGLYGESGWAVMILDKEFGREKLLKLLKSLNGIEKVEDFNRKVDEVYGIKLTYEWFNSRINKI